MDQRTPLILPRIASFALLMPLLGAQESESFFPAASPLDQGLSPEALDELRALVQAFVDDEEIVGAELLLVKNQRTVLHEAFGWSDREEERAMETDSLFCVRSMTKPLIGTAILMLIDEKRLSLDDHAADYLPYFDNDECRDITIEHLLTHTSGFPFSLLQGREISSISSVEEVARLGAEHGPEFPPGTSNQYSDQGTDTLTAILAEVTGAPAEEFIHRRILEPLGMSESFCLLPDEPPLRGRSVSKYLGFKGSWSRFWKYDDAPLFPCFLGSQGLYSTTTDYARFLHFWMRKGRVDRERLLSLRSWRKALERGPHRWGIPTGLPGCETDYGYQMITYRREVEGKKKPELVAFGHNGSDGTYAWAFPGENALCMYFTQSRGNSTGIQVEEALAGVFLGEPFDPNLAAPPAEDYLGYYWEGENDLYRAVVRDGSGIGLEISGKSVLPLDFAGDDRWKIASNPSEVLAFQRSGDGVVDGYKVEDHSEFRFVPAADLPGVDEVCERVLVHHGLARLETQGPLRLHMTVEVPKAGLAGGALVVLAPGGRFRFDFEGDGGQFERIAFDGEKVTYASVAEKPTVLEGERAQAMRLDNMLARYGDWREIYESVEVIQRIVNGNERVLVVRVTPKGGGFASNMFVQEETGRVGRVDSIMTVPGMGRLGQQLFCSDHREVGGVVLPHRMTVKSPHPLLGTSSTSRARYPGGSAGPGHRGGRPARALWWDSDRWRQGPSAGPFPREPPSKPSRPCPRHPARCPRCGRLLC